MDDIPALKRFEPGDRLYVQAQQIWLILAAWVMHVERCSGKPTTITYGELAQRMGYANKRAGHMLSRQLGIIGEYCRLNNLPTLNSIVVNQLTGEPGEDVVVRNGRTPKQERTDVMRENWFGFRVPTTGTFRKVWASLNG